MQPSRARRKLFVNSRTPTLCNANSFTMSWNSKPLGKEAIKVHVHAVTAGAIDQNVLTVPVTQTHDVAHHRHDCTAARKLCPRSQPLARLDKLAQKPSMKHRRHHDGQHAVLEAFGRHLLGRAVDLAHPLERRRPTGLVVTLVDKDAKALGVRGSSASRTQFSRTLSSTFCWLRVTPIRVQKSTSASGG